MNRWVSVVALVPRSEIDSRDCDGWTAVDAGMVRAHWDIPADVVRNKRAFAKVRRERGIPPVYNLERSQ